jgi:hypothetical protein
MSPGLFRGVVGQILREGSKKRTPLILRGMSHYVTLKMKVVHFFGTSGSNLPKHTAQQPKIPAFSVQKQVCKMKLSALRMSFPADKIVNLRTSLADFSLQYSLSHSLYLDKEVSCYYHRLICI